MIPVSGRAGGLPPPFLGLKSQPLLQNCEAITPTWNFRALFTMVCLAFKLGFGGPDTFKMSEWIVILFCIAIVIVFWIVADKQIITICSATSHMTLYQKFRGNIFQWPRDFFFNREKMDAFPTFNIFQVFIEYLLSVMDFLFIEGSWAMPDSHHVLSLLTLNKISVKYQVQHFFF